MIALLAALALQSTPPPTHHLVLHVGGHTTVMVRNAHVRRWSIARANIVFLSEVHTVRKDTAFRLDATSAGSTSVILGCDRGEEVWLVDVM